MTPREFRGMLVLGRQVDGAWALTDGAGCLIGRFSSYEAAHVRAEEKRAMRPNVAVATSAGAQVVGETRGAG